MEHLLAGLNRAQHEAVTATEGYVRVIAGAGSGKTRALSHRFAYLVNQLGILPGNILCVTFTNKSANEMRQRIHAFTRKQCAAGHHRRQRHGLYQHVPRLLCLRFAGGQPCGAVPEELSGAG